MAGFDDSLVREYFELNGFFTRTPPKPGATVVVPAQGEQRQGSLMQTITVITQTLTALATVVVLARK